MINSIYKTPIGTYIDLDRLLTVSDPCFSIGSSHIEFSLAFQLREQPITFSIRAIRSPYNDSTSTKYVYWGTDGEMRAPIDEGLILSHIKTIYVDPILTAWQEWKNEHNKGASTHEQPNCHTH
jgi:hypothetical protein